MNHVYVIESYYKGGKMPQNKQGTSGKDARAYGGNKDGIVNVNGKLVIIK